jgi:hypothetical protein
MTGHGNHYGVDHDDCETAGWEQESESTDIGATQ